jgi:hypothetical protein
VNRKLIMLIIGSLLLFYSGPPLLSIMKEKQIESRLNENYNITSIIPTSPEFQIDSHTFKIAEENSHLEVRLDNQPLIDPFKVSIHNKSEYRYWGILGFLEVKNKEEGRIQTVVVQNANPGYNEDPSTSTKRQWSLYYIDEDGKVTKEHVTYEDRSSNPLAVKLIMKSGTSGSAIGYHSDILNFHPSFWFPFIYPYGLGFLSILFVVIGLTHLIRVSKAVSKNK